MRLAFVTIECNEDPLLGGSNRGGGLTLITSEGVVKTMSQLFGSIGVVMPYC